MMHPMIAQLLSHPATRAAIERALASRGTHGDTALAHVSPQEMAQLRAMGGVGTRNPSTGLPQFYGDTSTAGGVSRGSSFAGGGASSDAAEGTGIGGSGIGGNAGGVFGHGGGLLGLGNSGLGGFLGGGGLLGMAARGIGNALGPSQGVAGGYGAASLGGNRGLGGPMSGDRSSGALNRWYQIADALQQQGQAQGTGGGATAPQMPAQQPPATLAPMMSTTAGQDLTGGAFGALPAWATQPYQVGTAPTSYPVPYTPSQAPPQLYGGSGQGGAGGTLQSVLSGQGGQFPTQGLNGQALTPQQRWQREMAQRLGLTPQMLGQMMGGQ